ncbi:uncharacterized protein LOC143856692 [Tasmannia lanceolata]|uniref:uncharacterized protein LOC143856692 n=1 Tax=Tasmannia lanceolata TaxID=3420 RepID=UPI004064B892
MLDEYTTDICENWASYANYNHTVKRRLWVMWDPGVFNFDILEDSDQFIHGDVKFRNSPQLFSLTFVYARNGGIQRRPLWEAIRNISQTTTHPWAVLGDFNVVRSDDERFEGANLIQANTDDFNECLFNCALAKLRSVGHSFSWSNNSSAEKLKLRRLDMCLVNEEWLCSFPISIDNFKNPGPSDHSPILIQLDNKEISNSKRPFRFHMMWLEDLSLFEVVEKAWAIKIKGNPRFRVIKKLKEVKRSIKEWNNNIFGLCSAGAFFEPASILLRHLAFSLVLEN